MPYLEIEFVLHLNLEIYQILQLKKRQLFNLLTLDKVFKQRYELLKCLQNIFQTILLLIFLSFFKESSGLSFFQIFFLLMSLIPRII